MLNLPPLQQNIILVSGIKFEVICKPRCTRSSIDFVTTLMRFLTYEVSLTCIQFKLRPLSPLKGTICSSKLTFYSIGLRYRCARWYKLSQHVVIICKVITEVGKLGKSFQLFKVVDRHYVRNPVNYEFWRPITPPVWWPNNAKILLDVFI